MNNDVNKDADILIEYSDKITIIQEKQTSNCPIQ
jgi:hypothetical protein